MYRLVVASQCGTMLAALAVLVTSITAFAAGTPWWWPVGAYGGLLVCLWVGSWALGRS